MFFLFGVGGGGCKIFESWGVVGVEFFLVLLDCGVVGGVFMIFEVESWSLCNVWEFIFVNMFVDFMILEDGLMNCF